MKIATKDLTGLALDWAVAKCSGIDATRCGAGPSQYLAYIPKRSQYRKYTPSTNWLQGGPIIEREQIGVWPSDSMEGMWAARPDYEVYPERLPPAYGPKPLIAAMRCFCASKLGDEVDVPKELT